ncbi:hypothetical protein [Georgenia wangjunii]|uniref:hypothetical protein n=1 Tax=Georgenia wangjunii TaxID=3117730 RepID=UPI002F26BBF4
MTTSATPDADAATPRADRPHVLLRWGLPRDPRGSEHVLGFALTTVVTIVVTRGYLQLTGFPQVGGETLHVAHVLWGGLLMAVAMVLLLSFAGPVIRPPAAFVGGVGFGLFIDEVGKFLTQDNDYFFRPAPMIMYVTVVLVMIGADALHGRRERNPSEALAAAADHAVAGVAGGLSPQRRAIAEELLAQGQDAPGAAEVKALLGVVPEDHSELRDPLEVLTRRGREVLRGVVRGGWTTALTTVLIGVLVVGGAGVVGLAEVGEEAGDAPRWAAVVALASLVVMVIVALRGVVLLNRNRYHAFQWLRRALLVNLLITLVALFRIDPWPASAGMAVALVALGIVAAERVRLEQLHEGAAH